MPNLFVIAGPNGSGKSSFSKQLVNIDTEVFDGDKYVSDLKKEYPEIGSDVLQERVNEYYFIEAKEKAIKQNKDFAFETNFSSANPTASLSQFKDAGYWGHLLFLGINSLEESIARVALRVKFGGHRVSEDSIKYNFEYGYKNLLEYFNEFDSVTVYSNSIATDELLTFPIDLFKWEKNQLTSFSPEMPDWAKSIFDVFKNTTRF